MILVPNNVNYSYLNPNIVSPKSYRFETIFTPILVKINNLYGLNVQPIHFNYRNILIEALQRSSVSTTKGI